MSTDLNVPDRAETPEVLDLNRYGWRPDIPDHRDHLFAAHGPSLATLPAAVDLRPAHWPVYDQLQLGSCTANAIAAAIEFDRIKQGLTDIIPSRLFIYYNERVLIHTVNSDSGAQIRDGIKTVAAQGVCPEVEWPYVISKFRVKPLPQCYADALHDRAVSYARVPQVLSQIQGCLAGGTPVVFGFSVYSSFESATVAKTGVVPMPRRGEQMLGGHAVLAVGYDDAKQVFIVRNSWGSSWGVEGYMAMPYAYLTSPLASDFWAINTVST